MAKKNKSGKQTQTIPTQYDVCGETIEKMHKDLVSKHHTELVNSKFAFLFKNKPITKGGRNVIATVEKVNPKVKALTEIDFIITISYPTWKDLSDIQHMAALDHELMHCLVDDDEKTGEAKSKIIEHDLGEFFEIINRYGLVFSDLEALGRIMSKVEKPAKKVETKKTQQEETDDEEEEDLGDAEDDDLDTDLLDEEDE